MVDTRGQLDSQNALDFSLHVFIIPLYTQDVRLPELYAHHHSFPLMYTLLYRPQRLSPFSGVTVNIYFVLNLTPNTDPWELSETRENALLRVLCDLEVILIQSFFHHDVACNARRWC